MSKRLVTVLLNDNQTMKARVYKDADWNEYVVHFERLDNDDDWMSLGPNADYHADSKADALTTAAHIIETYVHA